MPLTLLKAERLRCLRDVTLELDPGVNVIRGENGSGKTSILEAAFLLGRGRSFRSHLTEKLITRGERALQVFGRLSAPEHRIGFSYTRDEGYVARLDGANVQSLAELPATFFVEVIDPDVHRLVEGPPSERRRWLDWGVFHVEQAFLPAWFRYTRALRQRNAALKVGGDPRPWDRELAEHGTRVAEMRGTWLDRLAPTWSAAVQHLAGLDVQLGYHRGWSQDRTLEASLAEGLDRDRERGTTGQGPHRADVTLRLSQGPARDVLSRGQQKLVAASLILSLMQQLRSLSPVAPTLLLDDPAAELDSTRLARLVELVEALRCQLLITSLQPDLSLFGQPARVFHVEHGVVRRAG